MSKTLDRIRGVIKKNYNIVVFADKINISATTLFNFLNDRVNIQYDTLQKIIQPLGMDILENIPDSLRECKSIMIEGRHKKVGEFIDGKQITMCFESTSSSHQGLILTDVNGVSELRMY